MTTISNQKGNPVIRKNQEIVLYGVCTKSDVFMQIVILSESEELFS